MNGSKEMKEGFFIYSNHPNQASQKVRYISDSRKELFRSIDVLHDLLLCKFDKIMKEKSKELNDIYKEKWMEARGRDLSKEERRDFWVDAEKTYRELFQELCLFLSRIGWMASKEIND